jgi:predicted transport protein
MKISKEITSESHGLRREYEIVLDERNNLEYVMSLLRQAYEQN